MNDLNLCVVTQSRKESNNSLIENNVDNNSSNPLHKEAIKKKLSELKKSRREETRRNIFCDISYNENVVLGDILEGIDLEELENI